MYQAQQPIGTTRLSPGTGIEVRDHFCSGWCRGYEVAEATDDGYRVLRLSDHYVLPVSFSDDAVRAR